MGHELLERRSEKLRKEKRAQFDGIKGLEELRTFLRRKSPKNIKKEKKRKS